MVAWWWLLVAVWGGGAFGFLLCALLTAGRLADGAVPELRPEDFEDADAG